MFLHYLTLHKTENLCCLPLSSVTTTVSCVYGSEKSRLCGYITVSVWSDIPLPLHMHASVFAMVNGFVDDALRNTVPRVNASARQSRISVFVYCQVV